MLIMLLMSSSVLFLVSDRSLCVTTVPIIAQCPNKTKVQYGPILANKSGTTSRYTNENKNDVNALIDMPAVLVVCGNISPQTTADKGYKPIQCNSVITTNKIIEII